MPEAWCCLCCWDVSVRCRKKIGNISSYQKKVRNPLVVSENTLETELNNCSNVLKMNMLFPLNYLVTQYLYELLFATKNGLFCRRFLVNHVTIL